jgi:hypothetical protein
MKVGRGKFLRISSKGAFIYCPSNVWLDSLNTFKHGEHCNVIVEKDKFVITKLKK